MTPRAGVREKRGKSGSRGGFGRSTGREAVLGGTVVTRFSRFFALLVGFGLLQGGALSGQAIAALLPASSLTATATSSSAITLRWSDPNGSESGYVVERSLSAVSGF